MYKYMLNIEHIEKEELLGGTYAAYIEAVRLENVNPSKLA